MPASTPTAPKKTFGTLPQPSSSPMGPPATTQPMSRRLQTSGASSAAIGSSQRPGLFSTIPSLKLGALPGTAPHRAGRGLPSMSSAGLAVTHSGPQHLCWWSKFLRYQPLQRSPGGAFADCGCAIEGQRGSSGIRSH